MLRRRGALSGSGPASRSEPLDEAEAAEHTVEVRVTDKGKRFTITAIAVK